jgi:hypothetical protein
VINCPGATATGGYRYPIPTIGFEDTLWPNAVGKSDANNAIETKKRLIIQCSSPYVRPAVMA